MISFFCTIFFEKELVSKDAWHLFLENFDYKVQYFGDKHWSHKVNPLRTLWTRVV